MAEKTFIRNGKCPKCKGKTEINHIESFPFPEDEQSWITEVCTNCDFEIETGFTSTNATTSFDRSVVRELTEKRVARSIQEISSIISSYVSCRLRPDVTDVATALELLGAEDFALLYVKLAELANSPLAKIRFDSKVEIMMAAEHDRQFGNLSEGMTEWYDNEARAEARNQQPEKRVLDSIVELIILVEKGKGTQNMKYIS